MRQAFFSALKAGPSFAIGAFCLIVAFFGMINIVAPFYHPQAPHVNLSMIIIVFKWLVFGVAGLILWRHWEMRKRLTWLRILPEAMLPLFLLFGGVELLKAANPQNPLLLERIAGERHLVPRAYYPRKPSDGIQLAHCAIYRSRVGGTGAETLSKATY